tara:strand:- start:2133 stop:2600 length:468 start_codon:yes stop_codon:yes gene_type:complete
MSKRQKTFYIAIHCSATKPSQDIGAKEIRLMHKRRGWSDIGYNIVIRKSGKVDIGRALEYVGAHVKGYNSVAIGVCLVGGINESGTPEQNYTQEQYVSLEQTIRWLDLVYPDTVIKGHRDFSPDLDGDGIIESHEWLKQCPCFDVKAWTQQNLIR